MTVESVIDLVIRTARDVAAREEIRLPASLGPDTTLFGEGGFLDSLGLVSLVLAVEEAIEDEYGVAVSLADERAMSRSRSPFRSVGALAEYAMGLVEQPLAPAG